MNVQKAGAKLLFSVFIVLATTFPLLGAGQQGGSLFDRESLSHTTIQSAFRYIESNREAIVQEWIKLTEIPAPSTMEDRRAAYIREQLEAIGVDQIAIDEKGNMIATLKGSGGGPTVALAAHMDTVFNEDTPIKVRREEERLYAPGVGDDTSGCIGLLWAVRALKDAGIQTKGDFLAVFTVEEELGLFGARKFLEDWEDRLDMFVAVDGGLGTMSYGALGACAVGRFSTRRITRDGDQSVSVTGEWAFWTTRRRWVRHGCLNRPSFGLICGRYPCHQAA